MAENTPTVYLGYVDEEITGQNKSLQNFTVNKIGGLPDWANSDIEVPNCPICSLKRPLILQVYAPLENSQFHRSLYIFSCLNPSCSNLSKCWHCIRIQVLKNDRNNESAKPISSIMNITWCSGAEDWSEMEHNHEQNGNDFKGDDRASDDDECNSMESDYLLSLGTLNIDYKNANCDAQGVILDTISSASTFAEIEDESENVTVDRPYIPERDLVALPKKTSVRLSHFNILTLKSFFVAVDDERILSSNDLGLSEHVCNLIREYQIKDDCSDSSVALSSGGTEKEVYEQDAPAHGDIMFYNFLSIIQTNPGQIMRYSRDAHPLFISRLCEPVPKCQNCGAECICEIQILPTLIPKLRLETGDTSPIEFGTVLIFTCLRSCWDTPDKMRMEHIIVQQES